LEVKGSRIFKVKWVGYPSEEDSWISEQDIFARDLLAGYCWKVKIPVPSKPLLQSSFGESEQDYCFWRGFKEFKMLTPNTDSTR
jgi:hypothetical protein